MALPACPGPARVERAAQADLFRVGGNLVKSSPLTLPKAAQEFGEICHAGQIGVVQRKADWEIKTYQSTPRCYYQSSQFCQQAFWFFYLEWNRYSILTAI
jgi:hypothetical protein